MATGYKKPSCTTCASCFKPSEGTFSLSNVNTEISIIMILVMIRLWIARPTMNKVRGCSEYSSQMSFIKILWVGEGRAGLKKYCKRGKKSFFKKNLNIIVKYNQLNSSLKSWWIKVSINHTMKYSSLYLSDNRTWTFALSIVLFSDKTTDKLKMKHFKPLIVTVIKMLRQSKYDIKKIKRAFTYIVHYWTSDKLGNERPQMVLSSMRSSDSFKIDWFLEFHKPQGLSTSLFNHTTKKILVDDCYIKDSKQLSPLRFLSFLWCLPLMHLQPPNYWAGSNEPCPCLAHI